MFNTPLLFLDFSVNYLNNCAHNIFGGDIMGKFKFISLIIIALFLICGIVMFVDAPTSFDDSLSLIPTSDSSVDVNQNCENGTCLVDSNSNDTKSEDNSAKQNKAAY